MSTGLQSEVSRLYKSSSSLIRKLQWRDRLPSPPSQGTQQGLSSTLITLILELRKTLIRRLTLYKVLQVQFRIQRDKGSHRVCDYREIFQRN